MSASVARCSECVPRCGSLAAREANYISVVCGNGLPRHGGRDVQRELRVGGLPFRSSGQERPTRDRRHGGGVCRTADGKGAGMGALRKAGVWLGLVEEDE